MILFMCIHELKLDRLRGGGERTKLPLAEKRGRCFWRDRPRGEVKFRPTVVDGMNLLK